MDETKDLSIGNPRRQCINMDSTVEILNAINSKSFKQQFNIN